MTMKPSIVQVESTDGKFFSRLIDWLNNADVERDSTLIRVLDGEQPDPELTRLQAENARLRDQDKATRDRLIGLIGGDEFPRTASSATEMVAAITKERIAELEAENDRLREACRLLLEGADDVWEADHAGEVNAIRQFLLESEAHDEATQSE